MKKLLIAAAAVFALAACGSDKSAQENRETAADSSAAEAVVSEAAPAFEQGKVTDIDNDALYRPGKAVDQPTIIDFNATWCGPCRAFAPVFHAAAQAFPSVRFVSVDIDKNPETAQAFGITAVPTIAFISTDGSVRKVEGAMGAEDFSELVKNFMNK